MNEQVFFGYIIKDVRDIFDIETIIYEMRKAAVATASQYYKKLLQHKIETVVDQITLNQRQRPENASILDIAADELRQDIFYAQNNGLPTEYNFDIISQLLVVQIDGKQTAVLRIIDINGIYRKSFRKIKELVPFEIFSNDIEKDGSKKPVWDEFLSKYDTDIPITIKILVSDQINTNPASFTYRSPSERAEDFAREKILNHLVFSYAKGGEIPPEKLAEYVLKASERMSYGTIKRDLTIEKYRISRLLPEITFEMIIRKGTDPIQPPVPEAPLEEVGYPPEEPCYESEPSDCAGSGPEPQPENN